MTVVDFLVDDLSTRRRGRDRLLDDDAGELRGRGRTPSRGNDWSDGPTIDDDMDTWIAATEGNKVGVAPATGSVGVLEEVTGEAADFAPESFSVRFVCTSAVGTRLETEVPLGDRGNLTLVEGGPQTVEDISWGSECMVHGGRAAALPTDFDATRVTVGRDDQTLPVVIAPTATTWPDS